MSINNITHPAPENTINAVSYSSFSASPSAGCIAAYTSDGILAAMRAAGDDDVCAICHDRPNGVALERFPCKQCILYIHAACMNEYTNHGHARCLTCRGDIVHAAPCHTSVYEWIFVLTILCIMLAFLAVVSVYILLAIRIINACPLPSAITDGIDPWIAILKEASDNHRRVLRRF